MPRSLNLTQFFSNADDPVHQHTPIKLNLAFTRTAKKAAATALTLKMRPTANKPASLERQGRQFNLKPASMRLRTCAKNFKYQCGAINNLAVGHCFKIALLHRCQSCIYDNQRVISVFGQRRQSLAISFAKKRCGTRFGKGNNFGQNHIKPDCRHQQFGLLKHHLSCAAKRHNPNIRMNDKGGVRSQKASFPATGDCTVCSARKFSRKGKFHDLIKRCRDRRHP